MFLLVFPLALFFVDGVSNDVSLGGLGFARGRPRHKVQAQEHYHFEGDPQPGDVVFLRDLPEVPQHHVCEVLDGARHLFQHSHALGLDRLGKDLEKGVEEVEGVLVSDALVVRVEGRVN